MNQFNNDTLRFQDKIIRVIVPDEIPTVEIAIEIITLAYQYLYGVVIALFKSNIYLLPLNKMVTQRTIDQARVFLDPEIAEQHLDIIPFPKQ